MISIFFEHELKAFWRSKNAGKSVAVRILMGVLILYLLLNILVIAFLLDKILDKAFPDEDMIPAFCGILLYYYLFDLLLRLQLQELPTLKVQPYLHLPVKRNTLIGYLSFTALFSVFNLWPVILFTPFVVKIIGHEHGAGIAALFILAIIAFTILNNYLALYIKRKSNLNGWVFILATLGLVLIGTADFGWHLYSIRKISQLFFGHLITQPVLVLLPVIIATVIYYFNFQFLKGNLYLEELGSRKASAYKTSTDIPLMGYFGHTGDLVANEIKLIIRNKRTKSTFVMSLVFLFYGLVFYTNPVYEHKEGFKLFCGMFMTGVFIISYGRMMYAWQGSHFDGLLVSKVRFVDFLKSKYLLFTMVSTLAFILTIPYVYYGWHILFVHFVMYLWNIGINTTIVLYFANRNYKRVDLSKSASFNWEGVGFTQFLISFLLIGTSYIVYGPFAFFGHANMGLIVMAIIGLTFVFTRSFWIKLLTDDFYQHRYTIAEGFREK